MVEGKTLRVMIAVVLWTVVAAAQVVVPVVVKDASGAAVHGLQASDFALGCKNTIVQSAEEVAPVTVDGFSEPTPVFIVYDAESIKETVQKRMNALLLSVLRTEETQHRAVTLLKVTRTGIELINNFSTPSDVVLSALDRVTAEKARVTSSTSTTADPEFAKKVDEEVQRLKQLTEVVPEVVRLTQKPVSLDVRLGSLQRVATSLQGSKHRKVLLWITGMLPVYIWEGGVWGAPVNELYDPRPGDQECHVGDGENGCSEKRYATRPNAQISDRSWAALINSLNDSRITVYTAFVSPIPQNITECCVRLYQTGPGGGLDNVARSTGGKQLPEDSMLNFEGIIEQLRHDVGPYYLLTIKSSEPPSAWVQCPIKVNKDNLKLDVSDGFFAMK